MSSHSRHLLIAAFLLVIALISSFTLLPHLYNTYRPQISNISPTPVVTFTPEEKEEAALFDKCGVLPPIDLYDPTVKFTITSDLLYSQDCKYLAWSSYDSPPGASNGEAGASAQKPLKYKPSDAVGLFIYNIGNTSTTRLYTPKNLSDVLELKKWSDSTHLYLQKGPDYFTLDVASSNPVPVKVSK